LTGLPTAAWYPDPAQPELLRWWDGTAWSVHTMAKPDETPTFEAPAAAPVAAPVAAPAAPSLPPVLHTVPQSIPEPMPFASGVSLGADGPELPLLTPIERAARAEIYAKLASSQAKEAATPIRPASDPFGDFSNSARMNWTSPAPQPPRQQSFDEGPLSSTTLGVWLLVLWPVVGSLAITFFVATFLDPTNPVSSLMVIYGAILGYLLIPFLFAGMDRSALKRIGHIKRPAGWWLLTTWLGYLIARTVILSRRSRKAFVPLLVYVLIGLASATYSVLTSPQLDALINPPTIQEQVATALENATGTVYDVNCPAGVQPPVTCHAAGSDGSSIDVEVTLESGILRIAQSR
jgi:hypothetical protein